MSPAGSASPRRTQVKGNTDYRNTLLSFSLGQALHGGFPGVQWALGGRRVCDSVTRALENTQKELSNEIKRRPGVQRTAIKN